MDVTPLAHVGDIDLIPRWPSTVTGPTARRDRHVVVAPPLDATKRIALSIVIPVYNEKVLIEPVVASLLRELSLLPFDIELILCENGSTDGTRETLAFLVERYPQVRLETLNRASYGNALKTGIRAATSDLVIIFNADLWCMQFLNDSVSLLQNDYDMVIGSKRLNPELDSRPALRRFITYAFNRFLKLALAFEGTDTHGMKAFRKSVAEAPLRACLTEREVFDTELVLRLQRARGRICELPVAVADQRPARLSLLKRIPSTVIDLWKIWKSL